ncbi:ABC transporter permease [Telluribacter humicola]|uniref:ABC transporter permease n=1 Tax=Telluribacter humicola TaxID=1720261 RepID=UPI001A97842F|nr:ABC transporter permease [Telluribacter humicola]
MLKNYLKIAWRSIARNKVFSFINVTGLSLGVAACLLIALYIFHETSYDKQVPNAENIYRLYFSFPIDGKEKKAAFTSANLASTLLSDFEEVEKAGRLLDNPLFYGAGSNEIKIEGESMQHHEEGFAYADQSILDIFQLPMVEGDPTSALAAPRTVVISEKKAKKYFKDASPIGKSIYLNGNDKDPFLITGVMRDLPSNSNLDYDFLITLKGVEFGEGEQTRWLQTNYFTYIQLKPETEATVVEKKISDIILSRYLIPALQDFNASLAKTVEKEAAIYLQPLSDIHLYSSNIDDYHTRGDIRFVWLFGAVALFILLIACVNFVNLSTAQSANRAKEVGLRKVVGSQRGALVGQFLTESTLVTVIAFLFGIVLAALLLPFFNTLAGKELSFPSQVAWFVPAVLGSALFIGVLAGLYPAFYLSRFNPIEVLKGKLRRGSKSAGMRGGLVVFQFTVSIVLIVGTLIINKQMNYILTQKVGFERDKVIQLYGTNMLDDQVKTFKSELKQLPGVADASISDFLPIEGTKRNGNTFYNEGREKAEQGVTGQSWDVDEDYLSTLGMKLIDGRNFSKDRPADTQTTIINQTLAQKLGLAEPVGKRLSRYGELYEIIGVVEDFNFRTMQDKIEPLALFYGTSPTIISIKATTSDMPQLLKAVEAKWKEFAPGLAFRYQFMDQSYATMYESVQRVGRIFTSFAILAIFVACIGLYALSAFLVEQRSKEMSIRKVLGASMQSIFQLLTRHFLGLIVISLVVATPLAYFMMEKWLEDYVYRTDIEWWVFAAAGLMAILITLITISYHAAKSALMDPVKSLKSE